MGQYLRGPLRGQERVCGSHELIRGGARLHIQGEDILLRK